MDKKHSFILYLLPTYRGNVNCYKSIHHPIPTLPLGTGRKKAFFWKGERKRTTLQDYHLADTRDEKVSPFAKFEMILPLLCFLLDPLTNKHCSAWSSMMNLSIDYRTCQK